MHRLSRQASTKHPVRLSADGMLVAAVVGDDDQYRVYVWHVVTGAVLCMTPFYDQSCVPVLLNDGLIVVAAQKLHTFRLI